MAAKRPVRRQPHGLVSSIEFAFNGVPTRDLSKLEMQLVTAMWDSDTNDPARPRHRDDVLKAVYKDDWRLKSRALDQLVHRAQGKLDPLNLYIECNNDHFDLQHTFTLHEK